MKSANGNHEYTNTHMQEGSEAPSDRERRKRFGAPWREQTLIEDNPVGISREAVEDLIPHLDNLQASLWIMYHQYHKHHWLVEGPQFMDLHRFLEDHYNQVHVQIDAIAERITALGGIPTSDPVNQAKIASVQHEPEGTYRIRDSLRHDRAMEGRIAGQIRRTIDIALEHHDHGTKHLLDEVLFQTEERAHHLDHFLGEDALEVGLLHTADEVNEG